MTKNHISQPNSIDKEHSFDEFNHKSINKVAFLYIFFTMHFIAYLKDIYGMFLYPYVGKPFNWKTHRENQFLNINNY